MLKADAGAISLESVLAEIAKLTRLRALGLSAKPFGDVSLKVVERFRQRAAVEATNELRAHAPALRATLLAALCWLRGREVTDHLVDLLIQGIHRIGVRAEKRVDKQLLRDLKRVTGQVGLLVHIAEASVARPDGRLRDAGVACTSQPSHSIDSSDRTASSSAATSPSGCLANMKRPGRSWRTSGPLGWGHCLDVPL